MTPDQVTQYGLVGIALFAIIMLIRLMQTQADNQSKILQIQASLDAKFDKQTSTIDGMRVEVALSTQTAKATQPFLKELVDTVRYIGTDTSDAVKENTDRAIERMDKESTRILEGIGKDLDVTVAESIENQNKIRDEIVQKVDAVAETATTIDRKVTKLAPIGEIFYRVEENLRAIGQTLDKAILLAAVSSSIAELRTEISTRLTAIETDVKTLHQAAQAKVPSFDDTPTQSTAIKRKTEPIPPMPASTEAAIMETIKQVSADAPPEVTQ